MAEDTTKEVGNYPDEETRKLAEGEMNTDEEINKNKSEKKEDAGLAEKKKSKEEDAEEAEDSEDLDDSDEDDEEEQEEGAGKVDKTKDQKSKKRTPSLIPKFVHEIEKKKWGTEKTELLNKISELEQSNKGKPDNKQKEAIKSFATKFGLEEEMVSELITLLPQSGATGVDSEIKQTLETLQKDKEASEQEKAFNLEYSDKVDPLLEKDDVPAEKRGKLKKLLKDLAFTDKYAGNDLDEIYIIAKNKGMIDNLGLTKGKKSAESSRGGSSKGTDTQKSPEEMTDAEFEAWSNKQAEGQSRYNITHPSGN